MSQYLILRQALKEQYHAGLTMLAECVEKCPDDLWVSGTPPRTFCRIAWHTAYFTHNNLVQDEADFNRSAADWPEVIQTALGVSETQKAVDVEPYELQGEIAPLSQSEIRNYLAYIDALIDTTIDSLDLDATETGFSWYPNMSKMSNELMNLRHIQGHVGQLSELLMARDIDIDWVGKA